MATPSSTARMQRATHLRTGVRSRSQVGHTIGGVNGQDALFAAEEGTPASRIVVATDGSCLGNPGPGGWAWYVDSHRWQAGASVSTTNNQMELQAVLEALRSLPRDATLHIESDSKYAIDALTSWIHNWRRRGWKTSAGKPVANRDLIVSIDRELTGRNVTFKWVRGHAGHERNEAADLRARAAATAVQQRLSVDEGMGWT